MALGSRDSFARERNPVYATSLGSLKTTSSLVTVTSDPSYTALVISAPDESFGVIDGLVQSIDKSPAGERPHLRKFVAAVKQRLLARSLKNLFGGFRAAS